MSLLCRIVVCYFEEYLQLHVYVLETLSASLNEYFRKYVLVVSSSTAFHSVPRSHARFTNACDVRYALLHACKNELPSAKDAGVREAFDMIGDPVDNVRLPVDLSSSVLRELAKSQHDASDDCVSAGPRTYPGTNVELAR